MAKEVKIKAFIILHVFIGSIYSIITGPLVENETEIELNRSDLRVFENVRSGNYSNLLLFEEQNWLFATGDNYVFRLNARDISDARIYKERETLVTNKILGWKQSFDKFKTFLFV